MPGELSGGRDAYFSLRRDNQEGREDRRERKGNGLAYVVGLILYPCKCHGEAWRDGMEFA